MDEINDSGFVVGQEFSGTTNSFHDFREIVRTSHAILTTARKDGRRWMLKSLPEELRQDPMCLALQRKEYEILCRLNHPAVVNVFELVDIPALGPSIVMEYVDGQTLDKAKLSKSECRRVARSLSEALVYIHSCQVVHRDLKPTNIIITHNGHNVKIVDFGLADTDAHTIMKQPAGTVGYMSREQATSNIPDVRNDIYSLGLIFKELDLGWQYKRLIGRMLLTIGQRTPTMKDVLRQMDRAGHLGRRLLVLGAITLCLIIVSVIGFSIQRDSQLPEKDGVSKKAAIDTTSVKATTTDTAQVQISRPKEKPSAERKTQTEQPSNYDTALENGKAEIDAFMQKNHFTEMADTVTYHQETKAALNRIMGKAATLISEYAKEHTGDEPTRMAMKKQLDEYVVGKYWTPYYIRTSKL